MFENFLERSISMWLSLKQQIISITFRYLYNLLGIIFPFFNKYFIYYMYIIALYVYYIQLLVLLWLLRLLLSFFLLLFSEHLSISFGH